MTSVLLSGSSSFLMTAISRVTSAAVDQRLIRSGTLSLHIFLTRYSCDDTRTASSPAALNSTGDWWPYKYISVSFAIQHWAFKLYSRIDRVSRTFPVGCTLLRWQSRTLRDTAPWFVTWIMLTYTRQYSRRWNHRVGSTWVDGRLLRWRLLRSREPVMPLWRRPRSSTSP